MERQLHLAAVNATKHASASETAVRIIPQCAGQKTQTLVLENVEISLTGSCLASAMLGVIDTRTAARITQALARLDLDQEDHQHR